MTTKAKVPYAEALAVAESWLAELLPMTERRAIAGSIRRRKPTVGDVEIVLVPKLQVREPDPFEKMLGAMKEPTMDLADNYLKVMLAIGKLEKRVGLAGHTAWGVSNKLAIDVASGIPIDFFSTTLECFPMLLVIRTGGKQTNINLANAAARRGWKLKPYHGGYQNRRTGEMHICKTEEECFTFVGLQCPPPTHRP